MSGSDLPEGARDLTLAEPVSTPEPAAASRHTGDQGVDDVLRELDTVADEPLDTQIEVGERVYRALQGRLADLDRE